MALIDELFGSLNTILLSESATPLGSSTRSGHLVKNNMQFCAWLFGLHEAITQPLLDLTPVRPIVRPMSQGIREPLSAAATAEAAASPSLRACPYSPRREPPRLGHQHQRRRQRLHRREHPVRALGSQEVEAWARGGRGAVAAAGVLLLSARAVEGDCGENLS